VTLGVFYFLKRTNVGRGVFACVGWKVTLCDPIWQVTLRSCEMDMVPYWYQTHEQLHGSFLYFTLS